MSEPIHSSTSMAGYCADAEAFEKYCMYFDSYVAAVSAGPGLVHIGVPERYPVHVSSDWETRSIPVGYHWKMVHRFYYDGE